jgi:cell division protein FtsL
MKNWILLTAIVTLLLTGSSVFVIAQRMHQAQNELTMHKREIATERENLRVLQAEWTYLNNPDRLEKLATSLFGLQPIDSKQYVALNGLPTTEQMDQIELAAAQTSGTETGDAIPAMELVAQAVAAEPVMPAPVTVSLTSGGLQ